jgi:hypothetical protein
VGFDEQGFQRVPGQGLEGGIEPFDMSDLQDEPGLIASSYKVCGLLRMGGDGFFHKKVAAMFHSLHRHLVVLVCGDHHGYGLGLIQKPGQGRKCLAIASCGHFLTPAGVQIVDSQQVKFRQGGGQSSVYGP